MEEKMQMEELRKRIDNVQYKDIQNLREKIEKIEIDLAKNNLLTQQNTDAMNKMSLTMDSVRESMVQISGAIEYTSKINQELAENIRQQNEKIDKLQARQDVYDSHIEKMQKEIDENEEKNKIDMRKILKDNFLKILATVIGASILIEMILKNWEVF